MRSTRSRRSRRVFNGDRARGGPVDAIRSAINRNVRHAHNGQAQCDVLHG